jgi:hypothetical protein
MTLATWIDGVEAELERQRTELAGLGQINESVYITDPIGWARDRLGVKLWSAQQQIARSVVINTRTAIKSCHDSGKSFIAAVLAAWWIDVHPPGTAFVVSTAPTYPQVHAILWEEIRARHRAGKLPGRVLQSDEWKLDDGTLVGQGRKPADTDEQGFQGIHRRYVLAIIDEACGIPEQLWTAVETVTTTDDCRTLAIGNPDDPNTEFGKVCKPGSGWDVIGISAFATPNFTDEPVDDELRMMLLAPSWVDDKKLRWGEESPRYISKVLGDFPELGEDTLISPKHIEAAQHRELDVTGRQTLGVDVARFGSDRTIIAHAQGRRVRIVRSDAKQSTTETTGKVKVTARGLHGTYEIRVDGVGVGGGVVDQLDEYDPDYPRGWPVIDMQAGGAPADTTKFINARAEWFWGLREMFEQDDVDLDPGDDELAAQLGALKYKYTSRGQVQIESKDDMRKRGMPSPDRADAVMLALAFVPDDPGVVTEDDVDPDLADFAAYLPTP